MPITPVGAKFPAAIVAQADLGGPLNAIPANELVLNTSLVAGDTSVVATTTIPTTFPTSGWLTIDSELMHYSSYTGSTFTIDVRGAQTAYGHVAATTHTAGATIGLYYTAQALDQLHSEVIALETFFAPGGAVATIASGATTDLSTVAKQYLQVTGTTTITSFGTSPQGIIKALEFQGALTITHNATSLILRTGLSHTTVAGDLFLFVSEGGGNWRELARDTARMGLNGGTSSTYGLDITSPAGTYAQRITGGAGDSGLLMQVGSTSSQSLLQLQNSSGVAQVQVNGVGLITTTSGLQGTTNNVPLVSGKDAFGVNQTLVLADSDKSIVWGSADPRTQNIFQTPINLYKHHLYDDFDTATLNPMWTQNLTGTASIVASAARSQSELDTNGTSGSSSGISLPQWYGAVGSGDIIYFFITAEDALNQTIELGFRSKANPTTQYARFQCVEAGSAANYFAQTSNGGAQTSNDTTQVRDATRRMFIVDITAAGRANFYVGDSGGTLVQRANITTNLPTATDLQPYLAITNSAAVNKRLLVDVFVGIQNR